MSELARAEEIARRYDCTVVTDAFLSDHYRMARELMELRAECARLTQQVLRREPGSLWDVIRGRAA